MSNDDLRKLLAFPLWALQPLDPAVAKHLGILNAAGVVISTRRGRDRSNRLQPDALDPLRDWFKQYSRFWDDRLLALKRQVEEEDSP